jgi:hypothetical protein
VFDDEKQENGPEEQVVGLRKIARPNRRGVIGQKGGPALARLLGWQLAPGLHHVTPNGSLVEDYT